MADQYCEKFYDSDTSSQILIRVKSDQNRGANDPPTNGSQAVVSGGPNRRP
jgi:hypothetical protein